MTHRLLGRTLMAAALVVAAVLVGAVPASAHVTVQPSNATQGGFSALSFRIPTERDDASTSKVEITFPAEQPLAFVSVKPHPGWDYEVTRSTLPAPVEIEGTTVTEAVSRIVWTARSGNDAIGPGEYDDFSVSVGFLPESDQMIFGAVQTYDSGEVVRWIEEAAEGADEPEHPAPVLQLTPAAEEAANVQSAAGNDAAPVAAAGDEGSDPLVLGLAVLGALLGTVGAVLGGLAYRARSRQPVARERPELVTSGSARS